MFTGFGFVVRFPMLRQTQQFSRRHLDQREHLAALGDQGVVLRTRNVECAPEPRAFYAIQPAFDHKPVTEFRRPSVVNLGADHDRICLLLRHLHELEPEFLSKVCARDLDEAQIGDIGYDTSAVGVEKHYLDVCMNTGRHGQFHISDLE